MEGVITADLHALAPMVNGAIKQGWNIDGDLIISLDKNGAVIGFQPMKKLGSPIHKAYRIEFKDITENAFHIFNVGPEWIKYGELKTVLDMHYRMNKSWIAQVFVQI